ncbi:MAG TPA: stage II sporulation protein M [Anaerolineae bacterium]|nr:stage II sporulation protein M [Anaerolineae bacterium]
MPNVLRTARDYPLGYSTVTLLALLFAVTLGTNSFTLSTGGKQPPTFAIFTSSGLYEITAYLLAAAATLSLAKYRLVGQWPKQTVEAVVIPPTQPLIRERFWGLLAAILILVLATGWEAYRFAAAIQPRARME